MVYVGSVGLGIPGREWSQTEVKSLVQHLFPDQRKIQKLLPVFDHALIDTRQTVVDESWFQEDHGFQETNAAYKTYAIDLSLQAIDACLQAHMQEPFPYEAIDAILFVSSTGISTPSLDTYLINERPFREDVIRMPLWGLGCAGGAAGLARGFEWVTLHPTKSALIVCCELCSLTFQRQDESMSNLVGTALFGDGAAAALLIGEASPYRQLLQRNQLSIKGASSYTKKGTLNVMGWHVTNTGFEVIFSKGIPKLIPDLWKKHMQAFLKEKGMEVKRLQSLIAHPGGRKVLEAMESSFSFEHDQLKHPYQILRQHGNMSSATVLYVLKKWLHEGISARFKEEAAILCALGPGFSSELVLLEWMEG